MMTATEQNITENFSARAAANLKDDGINHRKCRRYEEALGCFDTILQNDPDNADIWAEKGFTHFLCHENTLIKDSFIHAREALQKALEIDPDQPVALRQYAYLLQSCGKLEQAREHMQRYLVINPSDRKAGRCISKIETSLDESDSISKQLVNENSFKKHCLYKRQVSNWHKGRQH